MSAGWVLLWLVACGPRLPWGAGTAAVPAVEAEVPEIARTWYAHAAMAAARGDRAEAERALGWLTRVDGQRGWTWLAVARVRLTLGDAAGAVGAAAEACRLDASVDAVARAEGLPGCPPP